MIWKNIPEYENLYKLNLFGEIESHDKTTNGIKSTGRPIILSKNKVGYMFVKLSKNGKKQMFQIQKLMALTFVGYIPDGKVVDHIDNNKTNNNINNLQFLTIRENSIKEKIIKNGYIDIHRRKDNGKWRVRLQIPTGRLNVGHFGTMVEALEAYDEACKKHNIINHNKIPIKGEKLIDLLKS